jgi:DNA damage-binding protein 1
MFHNGSTTKAVPLPPALVTAWCPVGGDGGRFLLGDHLGNLSVVVCVEKNGVLAGMHVEALGAASAPSCLAYLDAGVAFVGSSYGDSQLVRLSEERDPGTGSYLSLLQTTPNLGPVVDFALADLDRRGQPQVVCCCGARKDGSIRVVRNGIGIAEQASVELPGVKGMWRLRGSAGDE